MALPAHSEPWWIITRVTGVLALFAFLAAGAFGVLLARRLGGQTARMKLTLHRQLVKLALATLGLHILSALLDRHHVPSYAVVAPFVSPVRRIAAGSGSLALWGLTLVALTAVSQRRFSRSWRVIHRHLSYPAAGLAVAHALLGTDARFLTLVVVTPIAMLIGRALLGRHGALRTATDTAGHHTGTGAPALVSPGGTFRSVGVAQAQTVLVRSSRVGLGLAPRGRALAVDDDRTSHSPR